MHIPKAERVVQQVRGNASTNMEAGRLIFYEMWEKKEKAPHNLFEIVYYFGLWHPISLTPEI